MTKVNANTKKGQAIVNDWIRSGYCDIYDAYDRPSKTKVETFHRIFLRAMETEGYQHDLKICGANSSFYSTVYSVVVDGVRTIIKDTYADTYYVVVD